MKTRPHAAVSVPAAALRHLEKAYLELDAAHTVWGCWTDDVRQEAEKRLGLAAGEGREEIWADPEYGAALDAGAPYYEPLYATERGLAAADPEYARALHEGKLAAAVRARQAARPRKVAS